jgi:hypothetical protein
MNFAPVADMWELDSLDHDLVVEGYASTERGDPEPGPNRGKSYWHGWRCRMMDYGILPIDEAHRNLTREYLAQQRLASTPIPHNRLTNQEKT